MAVNGDIGLKTLQTDLKQAFVEEIHIYDKGDDHYTIKGRVEAKDSYGDTYVIPFEGDAYLEDGWKKDSDAIRLENMEYMEPKLKNNQ